MFVCLYLVGIHVRLFWQGQRDIMRLHRRAHITEKESRERRRATKGRWREAKRSEGGRRATERNSDAKTG